MTHAHTHLYTHTHHVITTQVFPESADIKPGCRATFRVAFRPPRDSAHFCQSLTLCAHIKAMRNFRLLSDSQVRFCQAFCQSFCRSHALNAHIKAMRNFGLLSDSQVRFCQAFCQSFCRSHTFHAHIKAMRNFGLKSDSQVCGWVCTGGFMPVCPSYFPWEAPLSSHTHHNALCDCVFADSNRQNHYFTDIRMYTNTMLSAPADCAPLTHPRLGIQPIPPPQFTHTHTHTRTHTHTHTHNLLSTYTRIRCYYFSASWQ